MYRHIVIPTDGSALSDHAIDQALSLAKDIHARVTLITVVRPFHVFAVAPEQLADTRVQYEQHAREEASGYLKAAQAKADALGIACDTAIVLHEHPYEAIIDTAGETGADLIAMASRGRRGVSALMLGSETLKVLTHSKIPVLVYRHG